MEGITSAATTGTPRLPPKLIYGTTGIANFSDEDREKLFKVLEDAKVLDMDTAHGYVRGILLFIFHALSLLHLSYFFSHFRKGRVSLWDYQKLMVQLRVGLDNGGFVWR
jgi:hypothetical protein